jgi:hypothetical protein
MWEDLQITNMAVPLSQLTANDADEPTIETISQLAPLRGTGLNADICGLLFVYNHDGKFHSPDPIS